LPPQGGRTSDNEVAFLLARAARSRSCSEETPLERCVYYHTRRADCCCLRIERKNLCSVAGGSGDDGHDNECRNNIIMDGFPIGGPNLLPRAPPACWTVFCSAACFRIACGRRGTSARTRRANQAWAAASHAFYIRCKPRCNHIEQRPKQASGVLIRDAPETRRWSALVGCGRTDCRLRAPLVSTFRS
jgi:hypothetical protein